MKVLVTVLAYNEGEKLARLMDKFRTGPDYNILIVDDGSTDNSFSTTDISSAHVIHHHTNSGVGAGIRTAAAYAKEQGYDVMVIMAANGKMLPEEIPRLLAPIENDSADYVQGSRYLEGGVSPNLPLFRKVAIRIFTTFTNIVLGQRGTDITCGFRAYRTQILEHEGIDIGQDWLGRYEMEYYLHYKAIRAGYRVVEVPVSMVYPESGRDYSKIKPFVGWWSMIRPWFFLMFGLKK